MRVTVTTSDKYHHLLPIFFRLYNREWGAPFDLVGYEKPKVDLPENCTWVSLGKQRGPRYFSDDLRPYFEKQEQFFIWLMEDTFIKSVQKSMLGILEGYADHRFAKFGRCCLTNEGMNRPHTISENGQYYTVHPDSEYRLSTQPSIWNRDFLLQYLTPGLSPWDFERQPTKDTWEVIGVTKNIVNHNEGVRKKNIHELNLKGIML